MRFLFKIFFILFIVLIAGIAVTLIRMIDDQPEVFSNNQLSPSDLSQARVFIENRDPRNLEPGEVSAFTMDEQDINLLLNYALSQFRGGAGNIDISQGIADMEASVVIPDTPFGNYLNIDLAVSQWGKEIAIERLRIGSINIPGGIANKILQRVHLELQRVPEYVAAMDAINGYTISDNRLNIIYQWQPDLIEQISNQGRDMLVSEDDRERILAHSRNLSAITNNPELGDVISLAEIMGPVFQFAQLRQGDPIEENRAAILAMSMYIMGISAPRVLGLPENSIPKMGKHRLMLSQRHDFAQHFLVSAGLAVSTGTGIADTIGVLKELDDADGGSGFSFNDIGADRTGVRFAELAVKNRQTAENLQRMLSPAASESTFMAEFRDLPEFMPQETFADIYGGVDTPRYNSVIEDIENRISLMPFFREMDSLR